MPTFRYSQSYVTRGAGKSVVATAAYYAAENLRQQGRGEAQANAAYQSGENLKASGRAFNFENKAGGVLHKEILAPEGAPEWAGDRQELWNRVDASEVKKNARLARKLVISLPSELSVEQNVALVRDFLKEQFVSQGIIADFAIHAPDHDGDSRHIHAHVLLTRRELRPEGFGKLFRSAEQGAALANDRKAWEGKVNDALERAGVHDRVSADSLYARGIVREPEPVLGDKAIEEERRQKHSKRGTLDERTQKRMREVADIRERNARRAEYDRKGEAHPRNLMEHYWRGRDRWMEQQQAYRPGPRPWQQPFCGRA
ncbi:MobA/MobL family protein [Bradyrhizobium yuanmingense]|uniref:MobA/MobL family protein n=1 Tax=Bradyrhizobium yuanmingense TaxID=108015 RepID=UPI0023B8D34B|nr:MobA/MobL family protein [Bradyrhizobium yuanmingense]MDF0522832.1 MobA/MobL family protein [Bradyrhizobium yuanmingense]